jgi:hypothetical protein
MATSWAGPIDLGASGVEATGGKKATRGGGGWLALRNDHLTHRDGASASAIFLPPENLIGNLTL